MARPRLLDLFCGAGGAGMGYHLAGFDVTGVDINPQPRYPFEFVQADALRVIQNIRRSHRLTLNQEPFVAIHASPPCQAYSNAQRIQKKQHPYLIWPTRTLLKQTGLPYVIENVPGAPLRDPAMLEGQMFPSLGTVRPRLFETNWPLEVPFLRSPRPRQAKMGRKPKDGEWIQVVGNFSDAEAGRRAMGIDWMTRDELREAIPPVYTEFIGRQLLEHLLAGAA